MAPPSNEFQVHKSKLSRLKKNKSPAKKKLHGKRKKEYFKSYRINDENRCESNENHMRARIRGRQTDREANRQKDTKTGRQIDINDQVSPRIPAYPLSH